jgi:hypothetical protein
LKKIPINSSTSWICLTDIWLARGLLQSRTTLFASFSGKRRYLYYVSLLLLEVAKPLDELNRHTNSARHSAKQNKRFLLLFLEKEDTTKYVNLLLLEAPKALLIG